MAEHYQRPGWFTKHVFNPVVAWLTRLGISVAGARVLEVTGRTSGEPRRTPVNLLGLDGARYLVAPRGEHPVGQEPARSSRGSPARRPARRGLRGRRGPRRGEASAAAGLSAALEVGGRRFFGGVGPDASDEELARIAPDHPAFRLQERAQQATPDREAAALRCGLPCAAACPALRSCAAAGVSGRPQALATATIPVAGASGSEPRIRSAARSAIAIVGAFVLPRGTVGMTEASTTRRPSTPRTRSWESTTDVSSVPMRQVPTGW